MFANSLFGHRLLCIHLLDSNLRTYYVSFANSFEPTIYAINISSFLSYALGIVFLSLKNLWLPVFHQWRAWIFHLLSEKIFILPLFLKNILTLYRILGWFFFKHMKYVIPSTVFWFPWFLMRNHWFSHIFLVILRGDL